ncbi:hypothetical protein B0T10DRAFT_411212 [Thelonectria olida]|uniref:Chromo domain-containing protein n=1 Tax=Thelonectria olida TaxID=1576542 RepID=A0A9P9AI46_9HYPO|nr:hypothetical protein B0T10DRAFT_411212 [Thelonectria olida]
MELVAPQSWLRGAPVRTTWSSDVVVKQVLVTLRSAKRMFHGIIASNLDSGPWDWPRSDCPIWVVDGGNGLSVWQECRQRPRLGDEGSELKAREVVGHYESRSGSVYLAVRWEGYEGPTWELESQPASPGSPLDARWTLPVDVCEDGGPRY